VSSYSGNLEYDAIFGIYFTALPVVMLIWIYSQWKWFQELKSEKTKAELALLKNQINPHFFFNTLNNLYGLTVEKSDNAPQVVLKLSEMMRYTIYEGKKDWVSLHSEYLYLNNFIELHQIRYQKKVFIDFNVPDLQDKIFQECKIAPLLLIILLENAFKHGVDSLVENAFIKLSLEVKEDSIWFQIVNNYNLEEEIEAGNGIGLDNLKKRLALIYPDKHSLVVNKTNGMKYLIIDDEPIAHRIIEGYAGNLPFLTLVGNSYNAMEAFEALNTHAVDLIFLDINMPQVKGFDFLKS